MNEALSQIVEKADGLLKQKEYQEVIDTIRPILIQDTGGLGQKLYGMAFLGLGQHFDAVQPLMAASQMLPNDVTVAFAYGTALAKQDNQEGARAAFERALGIDPNHPGSKMGYNNASKALAERDLPSSPMKAIEWLYGPWQREPGNPQWAGPIIDIYLANNWNEQAHQFVAMLPPELQNSPSLKKKMEAAPMAPPVDESQIPVGSGPLARANAAVNSTPQGGAVSALETCPFCRQQIMSGIHTCPHCKMIIRSKLMPGQDYKASWQEVTLNIFCWIGILLNSFLFIMTFVAKQHAEPLGALLIVISGISVGANVLILNRNDFAMSIGKWLYVMATLRGICGTMTSFTALGVVGREAKAFAVIEIIFGILMTAYSGLMVYLLNYEGAD